MTDSAQTFRKALEFAHKRLLWTDPHDPVCPYCGTRYQFSNEYEFGIPSIDVDTLERSK